MWAQKNITERSSSYSESDSGSHDREITELAAALREVLSISTPSAGSGGNSRAAAAAEQRLVSKRRAALKKTIKAMNSGVDVSSLFNEMVKAASTKDLVQKKLVFQYIVAQTQKNTDLVALSINTIQQDLHDKDPLVRGLALRTLCSMRISNHVELILETVHRGLVDPSSYVRKTAVFACLKLFHMSPRHVLDTGLIKELYTLLRDRDTIVIANIVSALNEILASDGGITINKNIAHYLLQRLREFNEWHQCLVIETLIRYKPESDNEVFAMMNILDDRLKHHNSGVQLMTLKLFLHLTKEMPELHQDVYKRFKDVLLTLLSLGKPEISFSSLTHAKILAMNSPNIFCKDYKYFYRRVKEPSFVTMEKLNILELIVTETTAKEIVDEVSGYIIETSGPLRRKSISVVASIAIKYNKILNYSLEIFMRLLETTVEPIVLEILSCLQGFDYIILKNIKSFPLVLISIWPSIDFEKSSPVGLLFLNFLALFGNEILEAPYIVESFIDTLEKYQNSKFRIQLLNTTVSLFLRRPGECREMLGRLFKATIKDDQEQQQSLSVRERGLFLYRLLQSDIQMAKKIFVESIDADILKEGDGNIKDKKINEDTNINLLLDFNTLSVVYGESSDKFLVTEFYSSSNANNNDYFDTQNDEEKEFVDSLNVITKAQEEQSLLVKQQNQESMNLTDFSPELWGSATSTRSNSAIMIPPYHHYSETSPFLDDIESALEERYGQTDD
ncbi:10116_t:CDS:10 [Ambispora leptoticha]|uniref:AP complex subunit beta n=1 Tax=Ambispora leptoticha TaxID=144679 RepID=A0A9N9A699_9GLOM|nr:10116_t:CDS:10 [Ambispora leptoticha]